MSQAFPEDSGWEDNNVFQSGAESSSPIRPPPRRIRRISTSARPASKSRKSASAPPQYLSESPERSIDPFQLPRSKPASSAKPASAAKPRSSVKPPSSTFNPQLPPDVKRETRSRGPSAAPENKQERLFTIPSQVTEEQESDLEEEARQLEALRQDLASPTKAQTQLPVLELVEAPTEDIQEQEDDVASDVSEFSDEQVAAVSKRISEGGRVMKRQQESDSKEFSRFARLVAVLLMLASSAVLYGYKQESSGIGFCNAGTATNPVLQERRSLAAAVELCQRENRTTLYGSEAESASSPISTGTAVDHGSQPAAESAVELCPLPVFDLFPHPQTCTPCPRYASCTPSSVTCAKGYVLQSHPLLSFLTVPHHASPDDPSLTTFTRPQGLLSSVDTSELVYSAPSLIFDGLPSFGPVAFPPRCVADPLHRRKINYIGKSIESHLAAERGMRLCTGKGADLPETTEIEQAKKWGTDVEKLSKEIMKKTSVCFFVVLPSYRELIDA